MIDRLTIDRIMEASNIVEVVSEFVTLKKSGANYKGLCPFHNESTPSFSVNPARNICHCFSCGKGGNPVGFLMEHEQLSYPEALRWLAKKYGIEIKERELTDQERKEQNERESMFIVNEWAATYFTDILRNDVDGQAIGMQYYRSRGFRDDIITKFRLGFDGRDRRALHTAARKAGYKEEYLEKTGLCYVNERGEYIDRYSNRVIFPWINLSGKVVGFSARVLDAATKNVSQKYVNSPASEIYKKDQELFGIYQAKKAISAEDRVYLVEGQTDVLSMHQCGIENVVAGSGTALSRHQVHMLHRFTNNITLIYDGDDAGQRAALKGTDIILEDGMNVKLLFLPDGDDPDSFARKHTAEEFKKYIEENETDFIQYKIKRLFANAPDPQSKSEAIDSIVYSISRVRNKVLKEAYLHEAAGRTGFTDAVLMGRMNQIMASSAPPPVTIRPVAPPPSAVDAEKGATENIERLITQMVVRHGGDIIYNNVENGEGELMDLSVSQYMYYNLWADQLELSNPLYQMILKEAAAQDAGFDADRYFINHHDIKVSVLASTLSVDRYALTQSSGDAKMIKDEKLEAEMKLDKLRRQVEHLILDFRMNYVDIRLKELKAGILQYSSDPDKTRTLMVEYTEMQKMRNALAKQIGLKVI